MYCSYAALAFAHGVNPAADFEKFGQIREHLLVRFLQIRRSNFQIVAQREGRLGFEEEGSMPGD